MYLTNQQENIMDVEGRVTRKDGEKTKEDTIL